MLRRAFFTSIFLALFLLCQASVFAADKRKVLFISSYSYDWATVPSQLSGYTSIIGSNISTHYLFMDTKKFPYQKDSMNIKNFCDRIRLLKGQYGEYDVITVADDAALTFAMDYKEDLFKDAPVVFMAVDDPYLTERAFSTGAMTGLFESHFDAENLELIKQTLPRIRTLFVITDDTLSGLASRREFERAASETSINYSFINISKLHVEEWQKSISSVEKPDAIFVLNFTVDRDNHYYTGSVPQRIVKYASVPVFSPIGGVTYCTAGVTTDYAEIGRRAAELVNRIIAGAKPSSIPVSIASPKIEFNYVELKKHGLKVPDYYEMHATVLNDPGTFLSNHYRGILLVLLLIIFATIDYMLVYLFLNGKKKERLIKELRTAKNAQINFLSRMSHDMRTPMNAVIGLSEFGLTETSLEQSQLYFKQIISSGKYLMGLLNDLLDMNKLETGKTELILENVNSKTVFDEILTIISPRAELKHITLRTDFSMHDFRTITVDKQRLEQVLINVLNNAVKYTEDHGVIIWTVRDQSTASGEWIHFSIRDNGVGMTEEFQKNLFKPFAQETNELTSTEGGSGLGLAIAKSLVTLMGGTISCSSKKGQGSEFRITIPMQFDPNVGKASAALTDTTTKDSFKDLRVLVCDDNAINRTIVTRLLQTRGAVTEEAEDGNDAVEKAKDKNFDLILMDVRMPVMNGLDASREIRKFNKNIPIIAVSANAFQEDRQQSVAAGMNAYEVKPINPPSLFATIKRLCY